MNKDLEILKIIDTPLEDKLKAKPKKGMCKYSYNLVYCRKKQDHEGNHKDVFGFQWK